MKIHQVRVFLAVCETLNFTRAAEQCNVSQPALTRAIKKLEEELRGPLPSVRSVMFDLDTERPNFTVRPRVRVRECGIISHSAIHR